jgi:3',5'-cyclic AMP phosphodiesterase CpdA/tetratricopeptide (TPR) repeat protein
MVPKLFVVMPFGRREVPHEGVAQDFDLLYHEVIAPAARSAGWEVLRIDEVADTGVINDQYLREIYAADVLLADITAPNPNVFYEIGLRHAISSGATLLIARAGSPIPFDLSAYRVFFYPPEAATGVDPSLAGQIISVLREHRPERSANPVRTFLDELAVITDPRTHPADFERDAFGRIARARTTDQLVAVWQWIRGFLPVDSPPLLELADRLARMGDHRTAVEVLKGAAESGSSDFEVHRQLGFHLTRLGAGHRDEALAALERALELNPSDPEALGMVGGIHKRAGNLEAAAETYAAGLRLAPDSVYLLVNQAALGVLTAPDDPAPGIARYTELRSRIAASPELVADHWGELVQAEAAFAVGLDDEAAQHLSAAVDGGASAVELDSFATQLDLLATVGFRAGAARALAMQARAVGTPIRTEARAAAQADGPAPGRLVVHLSDVHFGSYLKDGAERRAHRFFAGEDSRTLDDELVPELRAQAAERGVDPSAIDLVVSGDLTYRARPDEFEQAAGFLGRLCDGLDLPRDKVVLVPGNHDVSWPAATTDVSRRFDDYLSFLESFYGEDLFRERHPLITWDLKVGSSRPEPSEILGFSTDGHVAFAALSSCVYETDQDHYGFVGRKQLDRLTELVQARASDVHTKIAVLHHHLHPFPEAIALPGNEPWADASTTRDAGLVERRLEKLGFDLVLHGHKHKPQVRQTYVSPRTPNPAIQTARPLVVSGCGSTGVVKEKREHNEPTHYALIDIAAGPAGLGADRIRVEWRELAEGADAEWFTSQRWRF